MKPILLFVIVPMFGIMAYNAYAESEMIAKNDYHIGTAEWIDRCNMVGSASTVKITDYDMNKHPKKIEQFDIVVWSDSDNRTVSYTVVETGNNTGIFNSDVFFTSYDGSPGKRIRAFPDNTVYVKYVDHTLPNDDKKIEVIDAFVMLELSVLEWRDNNIWKLAYDPCTIEFLDKNESGLDHFDIFYPAPLKQIKSGLYPHEIKCKDNLELVSRYSNDLVCVKPETKQKLIERDWTKPT